MPIPVALVTAAELEALRAAVAADEPAFLADLERLVNIDCGSYTKAGVDEVGRWTADRLRALGATVSVEPNDLGLGDTIVGDLAGDDPAGPTLLCIGHMDTVFDPGTAAERPFAIADGIATGPGVTDMKSGLLAGLYAIAAIRAGLGRLPLARLVFVANPDEEIGSPASTPHIRRLAADADACLVLECARANGDIVSSRKGNLGLGITVHGRAAHAGVEPEKGRSAILEAARIVTELHALNGRWPGVTVNVGAIAGGTRPNVVAERCSMEVDVRAVDPRHAGRGGEAAIREACARTRRARRDRGRRGAGPALADGEAGAVRAARGARGGARRRSSGSSSTMPRPAAPRTPTRRRGWGCRRSTGWARSAASTTRRASTSRWPRSCRGPRSSPRSSPPSGATRRSAPGAAPGWPARPRRVSRTHS